LDCIKLASNTKTNKHTSINEILNEHESIVFDIKEIANILNTFLLNYRPITLI
jgi:hypothetical protein